MLKKLMKHELMATGRVMGPMLVLVLFAAVCGNIGVQRLLGTQSALLHTIGGITMVVFVASIMAACIAALGLMIQRFYKNLLRDEGYLMMTLPVSVHEHIAAKLLTTLIWWFAVAAVVMLAMGILVFNVDLAKEMAEIISGLQIEDLTVGDNLLYLVCLAVELMLLLAMVSVYICLHFYAAMAVGHSFTHHKGALSVAAFFALGILWSVLQNGVLSLLNLTDANGISMWVQSLAPLAQMHTMLLGAMAWMAIPSVLWYAVTAYCLKYRLNLG